MDEDLLFKPHKDSKIQDIALKHNEKQKHCAFSQKSGNGYNNIRCSLLNKTFKNTQEKTTLKVLQNYDYKTNILSNIRLENNITSSLLSNICQYSFSSDYLFKNRRSQRCTIRNYKNENIIPISKKMILLSDKCDSGFNSFMKNSSLDRTVSRATLCDFEEPCLSNRQSNLKRKLDSDTINELKLDNRYKSFPKSTAYSEIFERTHSHSKHFKSDNSTNNPDHTIKHLVFQTQFINKMDYTESYTFKHMRNIEIQSSPVKIRVAANFGEDSVEYVDPTMEVEVDSDESDPDEPGEQNIGATEEPNEQDQAGDTNSAGNSENSGNAFDTNIPNNDDGDNSNGIENGYQDDSNKVEDKSNCFADEQCLDKDTNKNIEGQDTLDKEEAEKGFDELPREDEIDANDEKNASETNESPSDLNNLTEEITKLDGENTCSVLELRTTENDDTTLDTNKDEMQFGNLSSEDKKEASSTYNDSQNKSAAKVSNSEKIEKPEKCSQNDKSIEICEVLKSTEIAENIEDSKLNEDESCNEQAKEVQKYRTEKENINVDNAELESHETLSNFQESIKVTGGDITAEITEIKDDLLSEKRENMTEKELGILESGITKNTFLGPENELEGNGYISDNEKNVISNERENTSSISTKMQENFRDEERNWTESLFKTGKEEIECSKQLEESTLGNGNTTADNAAIDKDKEDEKETAIDSDLSESIIGVISESKDTEDAEMKSDDVGAGVSLVENEISCEEKQLEIDDATKEMKTIEKSKIEGKYENAFENEEQFNNLKSMNSDEDTEQKLLDSLSHKTLENEEDSIEKDSIEDADNYQSIERLETESQDLHSNIEKSNFKRGMIEDISEKQRILSNQNGAISLKENVNALEFDEMEVSSVQLDNFEEKIKKSNNISETYELNFNVKEVSSMDSNKSHNLITNVTDEGENINEENNKNTGSGSKTDDETELDLQKDKKTFINGVSENVITDSEIADENISDVNKKVDEFKQNLSEEQINENNYPDLDHVYGEKEERVKQKSDSDPIESSLTDILQNTTEEIVANDDSVTLCEEKVIDRSSITLKDSARKNGKIAVCENVADQEIIYSPEKQKAKSEQSLPDSVKVISPRKGIKVEEDEIETAISSIEFYDEMSDGNEQIVQAVDSSVFSKPPEQCNENGSNPCENITSELEDINVTEQKADETATENEKEKSLPLQATSDDGELGSPGDKVQLSTSPKKRKKKRKISRSRSAQKDGPTSATKRSQDSKGSARTTRSVSSTSARSPSTGEKKLPPIKAPVGTTPPPNIKQVKSKIGSLDNVTHKPKGGDKKVEHVKLEWNAKSKIGSLDYATHKPGGGDKKILTQKLDFKNVQSKVGSKDNLKHKPGGGNLKISTEKLDFKAKAAPKVGSLDNAKHKPGGGNVTIKSEKLHFKERAAPKIHSRSGSERGSSHGGSETQSPIMPSSPAPPEELPPLNEDENPSSQEETGKQENFQEKVECNGGETTQDGQNIQDGEATPDAQGDPSNEASPSKPEDANSANDANNDNNADDANIAKEDQLIAF